MKNKQAKARKPTKTENPDEEIPRTLDQIWKEHTETIRQFLDLRNDNTALCGEVEYILRTRINEKGIDIASISSRAKTLPSFLEKLQRKQYEAPLKQITDLAAVRVVCLYHSDLDRIHEVIRKEFEILEDDDKAKELAVDQFGYGARHYLVNLGKSSSGARYDKLKKLICEIQVRTVVQDAWAIVQHHMVYKKESEVPSALLRKLNSLAALFETVDDQYDLLKTEREAYVAGVQKTVSTSAFLNNELNLDSFKEYLKSTGSNKPLENWDGQASMVLEALTKAKFKTLRDVDKAIDEWRRPINEMKPAILKAVRKRESANIDAALALTLNARKKGVKVDPLGWPVKVLEIFKKHGF